MTSIYATDATDPKLAGNYALRATKEGLPLEGQVPLTITTVTATGALPARVGNVVRIDNAAAVTVQVTSLANLVGREITFCGVLGSTAQHIVQFPANTISGSQRQVTFAANSGASATFVFPNLTQVIVKSLSNATAS